MSKRSAKNILQSYYEKHMNLLSNISESLTEHLEMLDSYELYKGDLEHIMNICKISIENKEKLPKKFINKLIKQIEILLEKDWVESGLKIEFKGYISALSVYDIEKDDMELKIVRKNKEEFENTLEDEFKELSKGNNNFHIWNIIRLIKDYPDFFYESPKMDKYLKKLKNIAKDKKQKEEIKEIEKEIYDPFTIFYKEKMMKYDRFIQIYLISNSEKL